MSQDTEPTVLAVDDEAAYVEAFARWLDDEYEVRTATTGEEALGQLEAAVDVVLLDRRMPGLSGDEILAEIRARDIECQIAMVTAVEPDFDILDMGFDDYAVKPLERGELRTLVADLLRRDQFDEKFRECFSLASKKAALEANRDQERLVRSEEYRQLTERLSDAERAVNRTLDELLDGGEIEAAYRSLST